MQYTCILDWEVVALVYEVEVYCTVQYRDIPECIHVSFTVMHAHICIIYTHIIWVRMSCTHISILIHMLYNYVEWHTRWSQWVSKV